MESLVVKKIERISSSHADRLNDDNDLDWDSWYDSKRAEMMKGYILTLEDIIHRLVSEVENGNPDFLDNMDLGNDTAIALSGGDI